MRELYIIEYESAHWCGGASHCVAWASNESEAEEAADQHMDESMRELFADMHEDAPELDEEPSYTLNFVKPLIGSDFEEYYADLKQRASFYPCVNE